MIVGLTGGIGSGKSKVASLLFNKNVPVYIADIEAKKLMNSNLELRNEIIELLGKNAYTKEGLNRAYIAEKVFKNKELLASLNKIVHPRVHKDFKAFVDKQNAPYTIYESAILFENNKQSLCDKVIVVSAPLEERIKRVVSRDGSTREQVLSRINNQLSQEEKVRKADYVIENNTSIEALTKQVDKIHNTLSKL